VTGSQTAASTPKVDFQFNLPNSSTNCPQELVEQKLFLFLEPENAEEQNLLRLIAIHCKKVHFNFENVQEREEELNAELKNAEQVAENLDTQIGLLRQILGIGEEVDLEKLIKLLTTADDGGKDSPEINGYFLNLDNVDY